MFPQYIPFSVGDSHNFCLEFLFPQLKMKAKLALLSPCFAFSICCRIIVLQHTGSCFEVILDKDRAAWSLQLLLSA